MAELTKNLINLIKKQAQVFCLDNYSVPTQREFLLIESAFMAGALIGMQHQAELEETSKGKPEVPELVLKDGSWMDHKVINGKHYYAELDPFCCGQPMLTWEVENKLTFRCDKCGKTK